MDLSDIKLIATDMDGTLLNSEHELNPLFYKIFQKLRDKGILFAAASGRQFFNIYNKFPGIQEEIIFIAENGSYVVYQNEDLLVQAMPYEVTMLHLKTALAIPNVYPILCGKKTAYIDNNTPDFVNKVNLYYDRVERVESVLNVTDDEFLKIALCDLNGAEQNSYHYFKDKQDQIQVKISGSVWLDLSHKLANKGKALNLVQDRFGITKEQTMAFGDYLNDVEMMMEAHYSFSMDNAHPEVKKVARFSTRSNDEDGVLEVLGKL
jgi:Cof subfamily protein (haloacid dehalogenase superfamily)